MTPVVLRRKFYQSRRTMVESRWMKKWGWTIVVLGLACILAGILAKRVFDVRQYLVMLHIIGGLCLIVGGMMVFGDRSSKGQQP